MIVLYNLSLLVFTRDGSYFFYVLYLLSAVFYVLSITGFGQLYLWPEIPELSARFYGLSAALCFFTPMLFALRFRRAPLRRLGVVGVHHADAVLGRGGAGSAAGADAGALPVHGKRRAAALRADHGGNAQPLGTWQSVGAAVQHRPERAADLHRGQPAGAHGVLPLNARPGTAS